MNKVHRQDEPNLRSLLGIGDPESPIPEPIVEAYERIRRQAHRLGSGPLSVDSLLLVIHASNGDELVTKSQAERKREEEKAKLPGIPFPTSEGMVQPDVPMVGGREYYAFTMGDWHLAPYIGPGKDGKRKFNIGSEGGPENIVEVSQGDIRLTG